MKILIDVMGGDNSPEAQVLASFKALDELKDVELTLVGNEEAIKSVASAHGLDITRVNIVNAASVITMEDEPTSIRTKTDSSMYICLNMLKEGKADALVSSGNSGALLVGSTLFVRCVKGVRRAAFAPAVPTENGKMVICDSGANTECTPEMLETFGIMGYTYLKCLGNPNPRVGLINNGAEECKGTELYVEAHKLLKNADGINFIGNIEGRGVMQGECDVLVCDGFTGNIVLKTIEGAGIFIKNTFNGMFKKNLLSKLGAVCVMSSIKKLKKTMDYKEIGGAVLLGISKPVIKAHGSADEKAFCSAIRQAYDFTGSGVIHEIETAFAARKAAVKGNE